MPPYSYKITADHVQLKRIDDTYNSLSETGWVVRQLQEVGYDNIKVMRTDLATGAQVEQIIPVHHTV